MRVACITAILAVAVCALSPTLTAQRLPVGPIPADCNRACLEGLINRYLDAVLKHDPKGLPLSADVKYTEQEQIMEVGDGFWKTATGRGNYNHYFADPLAGQAGWMGTMREKAGVLLMTVPLRVQLGRITEIETSYFRAGGGGPNNIAAMDKLGQPEALWLQPIPPAQRSSRQQLINIANMDGTVSQIKLNTGEIADMSNFAGRASSIHFTEAFRIENNLIRRMEMIGTGVPYHFNSSWGAGLSGK